MTDTTNPATSAGQPPSSSATTDATASDAPIWTGRLTRGDSPGTVTGYLQDVWQWKIHITGVLDKEAGGYVLTGTTGEVPEALRVPIVDSPVTKDG